MADVFTPAPPPIPVECLAPAPTVKAPSSAWLDEYYGVRTPTAPAPAPPWIDGMDGLWAPPGMVLEYRGNYFLFDGGEVGAGSGFRQTVPADEVWRLNWVGVDWITNTGSSTRIFLVRAYNDTYDMWYVQGRTRPGDNSGGPLTFMTGVDHDALDKRFATEALPPKLLLQPGTTVLIQMGNAGDDFFNSARWNVDKWGIVTKPSAPTNGGTNTGGTSDGGLASGGPYWRIA